MKFLSIIFSLFLTFAHLQTPSIPGPGISHASAGSSIVATGKTCYATSGASSVLTEPCTWSGGSPAVGEFVTCLVTAGVGAVTTPSVTDNGSGGANTYAADTLGSVSWLGGGAVNEVFTTTIVHVPTTTTYSNVSPSSTFMGIYCSTWTGVATSTPRDGGSVVSATSGTTPFTCNGTAFSTSANGDLIFVGGGTNNGTGSAHAGFTTLGGSDPYASYQIQTTAGSITPIFNDSQGSDACQVYAVAYKHQ